MQIKIFSIPALDSEPFTEEMNQFLRAHRVADVRKELLMQGGGAWWTFCITYLPGMAPVAGGMYEKREKVDYKQVLDEATFTRFARMREVRKKIAADDSVPAYSVFYDAELADFAKQEKLTLQAMKKIEGIGDKRLEKYGEKFLKLYEASGESDKQDSGVGQPADSLF